MTRPASGPRRLGDQKLAGARLRCQARRYIHRVSHCREIGDQSVPDGTDVSRTGVNADANGQPRSAGLAGLAVPGSRKQAPTCLYSGGGMIGDDGRKEQADKLVTDLSAHRSRLKCHYRT